jgi:hypothetical protein
MLFLNQWKGSCMFFKVYKVSYFDIRKSDMKILDLVEYSIVSVGMFHHTRNVISIHHLLPSMRF